ncbi:amidase domain-containing protein [Kitasatospora sp. NPDC127111]|uniref:amidase domain-containing protein n=1 Tax=Kitasatospora sp. NPDC127111 TaxID=3345363 RepID=UPI003641850D
METTPARISRRRLLAGAAGTAGAAALATAAGTAPAAAAVTIPAPSPYALKLPHQIEAEALVDNLRLLPWGFEANRYKAAGTPLEGLSSSVRWGAPGHPEDFYNLSQCSSFVSLVLERAYGTAPTKPASALPWPAYSYGWANEQYFRDNFYVDKTDTKDFPNAQEYRAAFARKAEPGGADALPHFTSVTKPVNLRPGDLVAFEYEDDNPSPYTGHIVMIRERKGIWTDPEIDRLVGPNVIPYVFEIIDCTSSPHGGPSLGGAATELYQAFPDTRFEEIKATTGQSTFVKHNGVGYGHMIFYANADTKLFAGHRWSVTSQTPHTVAERPIAAGRVWLSDSL